MESNTEKRVYSCATAHLDTVWNWDFEHSVSVCLYNTLVNNFELFEKYPDYKFNFEGSYRYELFEEYYPELFSKLREYIASGRWNVAGSAYENGDVNVPSPEALFRNILYGNGYFKKTFGKTSKDIFLPDCFGFGKALPSVIRHANLSGFTTQKLTWGSAYGTPFDIGRWYGSDGKYCFACLKPDSYVYTYKKVRLKDDNVEKIRENMAKYSLPWTFSFHGAGDQGGAPAESSVKVLEEEIQANGKEDVKVLSVASDDIYRDLEALDDTAKEKLPEWKDELVMTNHGVGGYTSRAIGKRWSRRNEELADITERAAAAGSYLGAMTYPTEKLEKAWKRVIAHQFHDDLPGTSLLRAYKRSWNDYMLSLNEFAGEYTHSMSCVAKAMDTSFAKGRAVVVHNSLEYRRTGLVKCDITLSAKKGVKVTDMFGKEAPSQVIARNGLTATVAFIACVQPLGFRVYDITETAAEAKADENAVKVTQALLENSRYKVELDENGDICAITDKENDKQLLSGSIKQQLINYPGSKDWPAWELTYDSTAAGAAAYPLLKSVKVLYAGAATGAVEVIKTHGNSVFKSVISLDNDAGFVKIQNETEWWEQEMMMRIAFPLSVSNEKATFDLGLGVIERGNATENLYEVPAQKWADITENHFGVSVISDCKYGWNKPDDNTLRLTAIHTPGKNYLRRSMQSLMDVGLNRYGWAVVAHTDDITDTQRAAREFSQPLTAFFTDAHTGAVGSDYSFGSLNKSNVLLRALKKAEDSEKIVVRFNEGAGRRTDDILFTLGEGIESAEEIFADEEYKGEASVKDGALSFSLDKYEIRSFALTLKPASAKTEKALCSTVAIDGNFELYTSNNKAAKPVITDYEKFYVPAEIKPGFINYNGIDFPLGSKATYCRSQKLKVPKGSQSLYLLAFSYDGDESADFIVGSKTVKKKVCSVDERIGIWDQAALEEAAHIKDCSLAYVFTHAHNEKGADIIAKQMYVFAVKLDVRGETEVRLPDEDDIIVLSAVAVNDECPCVSAAPLYDVSPENRKYKNRLTAKGKRHQRKQHRREGSDKHKAPLNKRADKYVLK